MLLQNRQPYLFTQSFNSEGGSVWYKVCLCCCGLADPDKCIDRGNSKVIHFKWVRISFRIQVDNEETVIFYKNSIEIPNDFGTWKLHQTLYIRPMWQ